MLATYVGTNLVHNDLACIFEFYVGINAIMKFDGLFRDSSKVVINTECDHFGAEFCQEDFEAVNRFCNPSDIERFRVLTSRPNSDGQFIERLISFPAIRNEFYKILESKNIDLNIEGKFLFLDQLYKFAL